MLEQLQFISIFLALAKSLALSVAFRVLAVLFSQPPQPQVSIFQPLLFIFAALIAVEATSLALL